MFVWWAIYAIFHWHGYSFLLFPYSLYTHFYYPDNVVVRIDIHLGGRATRYHLTTWLGCYDIWIQIMMFCVNSGSYLDTFVW